MTLNQDDRNRLEAAVTAAEAGTNAEIVLAVADTCDDYAIYALLWGSGLGFIAAGGIALLWPAMHVRFAFIAVGLVVAAATVLLLTTPLLRLIVPRQVQERAAAALARKEFAERVAGRTRLANGVLIFVALAERAVIILPDSAVNLLIAQTQWQKIVTDLLDAIRGSSLVDGLHRAIEAVGALLAAKFPPGAENPDEISNRIVIPD